jgi:hypothetical protein
MYPAYTLPVWITDDQLLRDEAVLFGLSEARPDEKIASIRLAFAALTAPLEKQIEQHHETIGSLNLFLDTLETQPMTQGNAAKPSLISGWPIGAFLIGLFLSVLGCVAAYLGALTVLNSQVALLISGLIGLSGCAATLFISQAMYQRSITNNGQLQSRWAAAYKQQVTDRTNWQQQKRAEIDKLYQAEATLNQQNAHRDLIIRLFESEFDLARSLRHQVRDRFIALER